MSRIRWAGDAAVGTLLVAADVSHVTSGAAEPIASTDTVGNLAERGGAVDGPLAPIARPDPWH
ncbi:hypothetical protein [Plantactinospora sp. KLBMP9567]|uniref:hypothetical protein n=1 Tax=Plantactinospora sp. KLBMP9567 TaxID=3085900 RepID=UPI0029822471|nr:hypothetical protein [Plantactinospora sp. KLBMP9567]MDW5330527.1 hypothetical protein [Plantactinospora sp. KLBMP9567]